LKSGPLYSDAVGICPSLSIKGAVAGLVAKELTVNIEQPSKINAYLRYIIFLQFDVS
jgi:hypothetical protein